MSRYIRFGQPITFSILATFALIEAILTSMKTAALMSNRDNKSDILVSSVYLLTFASWWTLVSSIALAYFFVTGKGSCITSVIGHVIWLAPTWALWLTGSIMTTVGQGSHCGESCFDELHTIKAFAWICWLLMTSALAAVIWIGLRVSRDKESIE